MLILNRDKALYPNFAQFVQQELAARVLSDKAEKVWQAFKRHAQISDSLARKVLIDSTVGPLVRVADLREIPGEPQMGWFPNQHPDWVLIDESLVKQFEADSGRKDMQRKIEVTVLHEVVHWGDFRDGQHAVSEAGYAFERDAYGDRPRR